ncbi:hypothetical protein [Runella slithyformis]|uniref:Lipoprotein n=1 Tax=Runella slithyformis (strain ATCC 29530 / DSM 19594 / LMG 11500 / NCIMB 11436 / LSU 4) TaxID=761193 RepID=A0A7U3ZK07_RUNSL|nr:hypothetical protein [Runella slithyformis]AEI48649.1 hypothetical protein Runsl_2237 [Runella slithyformis DSM 19594]
MQRLFLYLMMASLSLACKRYKRVEEIKIKHLDKDTSIVFDWGIMPIWAKVSGKGNISEPVEVVLSYGSDNGPDQTITLWPDSLEKVTKVDFYDPKLEFRYKGNKKVKGNLTIYLARY